jgi:hypothetical protein
MVVHYCTMVALHTLVHCYIVMMPQTIVHYFTVVVVETVAQYYIVVVVCCYTMAIVQVSMLCAHPAPYMYLKSSLSLSPKFYSPCLHVQLTCKNYKIYSSILSDTFSSWGNDRRSFPCVLQISHHGSPQDKGLEYPL